jgi:flagellar biosynthesis protein FliR
MVTGLLVLARCAGFVFRAPGFSHPSVPAPLRGGIALLLAMAMLQTVRAPLHHVDGAVLVIALLTEFVLGSALGMAASLVYDAAYAGGRVVDDYVGVRAIAPSLQLVAPSGFGRLWSLAITGGFFLTGAYRLVVLAFAASFARMPPGAALHAESFGRFVGACASTLAAIAVEVAAPAVAVAFVVQIAVGAISRVVPRFGSFTLVFPMAFAAALIVTAIAVPLLAGREFMPALASGELLK